MIHQAAIQFIDLIAASPSLHTWTGAADASAAKEFIHLYRQDSAGVITQSKFIIIDNEINLGWDRASTGTGLCAFSRTDGLRFSITGEYTKFTELNAIDFISQADGILKDLADLGGVGDLFRIDSLQQVAPFGLDKNEDHFRWMDGPRRGYHLHFSVSRNQ